MSKESNFGEGGGLRDKAMDFLKTELLFPESAIKKKHLFSIGNEGEFGVDLVASVYGESLIFVELKTAIKDDLHLDLLKKMTSDAKPVYFIYFSNTSIYKWRIGNSIERIEEVPNFFELQDPVEKIHNNVLTFLLEKRKENENLLFKLRARNNNGRLDKGYWFLGNQDYVSFSFWEGRDYKNKTSSIYFEITPYGQVYLSISVKDSELKQEALADLCNILGLTPNDKGTFYRKSYDTNATKHYLIYLEDFLKRDKKIIDLFLRGILDDEINSSKLEDIGFVNKNDFEEQLNRVLEYKEKINSEIIPISTENNSAEINLPTPIILEKLSLINIGQFNKLELDLSKRITCIIGSNGIGKTTLLRAIAVGLVGFGIDEAGVLDTDVEAIQHLLRVKGAKIDGSIIYSESGRIILDYRIKGKSYSNPTLINLQEGNLAFRDGDTDNEKPSFNAMDGDIFKSLVLGFSQTITQEINKDNNSNYAPSFKDIEALVYNSGSNQFNGLKEWMINLNGEIGRRKQNKEPTKRLQEALDLIFNAVSGITETKIEFTGTEGLKKYLWVGIDDKEPILFSLLSQGYKKVFAWVGHFVRRIYEAYEVYEELELDKAPAIVLIDEVDTYLHPVWQKNILNVMSKMFPNVRFIITTHSPLVVTHLEEREDSSIIIIDEDGSRTLKTVYGKQISSAFNLLMGIDERAKEVQGKLNILFEELEEEAPEGLGSVRVKLDELLGILGDKDPDMTQAEAMYDYLKSIS